MTEIEKLRALLAEARPILWLHRPAGDMDCDCRECSAVVEVVARIDAALAESVQNYEALYRTNVRCECGDYDACLLTRQRDEARKYAKERNDEANKLQRFLNMAAQERDEARAEIERLKTESPSGDMRPDVAEQRQAFKRGAEAMREAAMGAAWHSAAIGVYKKIRDLPIPEDK